MININNKDIIWSYLSSFFSLSTSLLILPVILKNLSVQEIGFNYILSTITGLIILFDFGFSVQFARNFSYLFAGTQELLKDGISENKMIKNSKINFELIAVLISSAKYVYRKIAIIASLFLIIFGSLYVFKITNGFKSINHIIPLWSLFILSSYFNIYFGYYQSLLIGKGLIKELNQINVISRVFQLTSSVILIYFNIGLFSLIISNFIFPFLSRFLMHKVFFNEEMRKEISFFNITNRQIIDLTKIVWHNSKKLGLVFIGSFLINKIGLLISGLYLNLNEIASYGLMEQIFGVVVSISSNFFNTNQSMFSFYRVQNDKINLLKLFSKSIFIFYFLFFSGTFFIITTSTFLLKIIGSNILLPIPVILILYSIVLLLEQNHSLFATFISTKNTIPFVKPSIISGILIVIGNLIWFQFIDKNIIGLIIVPGLIQLMYNNWKWPIEVLKEFDINFFNFYKSMFKFNLKIK